MQTRSWPKEYKCVDVVSVFATPSLEKGLRSWHWEKSSKTSDILGMHCATVVLARLLCSTTQQSMRSSVLLVVPFNPLPLKSLLGVKGLKSPGTPSLFFQVIDWETHFGSVGARLPAAGAACHGNSEKLLAELLGYGYPLAHTSYAPMLIRTLT